MIFHHRDRGHLGGARCRDLCCKPALRQKDSRDLWDPWRGFPSNSCWLSRDNFNRKTPWSEWENLWFPVSIFPTKPIHWKIRDTSGYPLLWLCGSGENDPVELGPYLKIRSHCRNSVCSSWYPENVKGNLWVVGLFFHLQMMRLFEWESRPGWSPYPPLSCTPLFPLSVQQRCGNLDMRGNLHTHHMVHHFRSTAGLARDRPTTFRSSQFYARNSEYLYIRNDI